MTSGETESRADRVVTRLLLLYHPDDFPVENIGGTDDSAGDSVESVESKLDHWRETYGGQDAFACLVRTVLSQNTSDVASQPAFDALLAKYEGREERESPEGASGQRPRASDDLAAALADADHAELAETIRAGGLYNQKATVIVAAAERVLDRWGSEAAFDAFVREGDPAEVRAALLDFDGVGPKTADCVLLFSGGRWGVFPVDTHVHRIYRRLGIAPPEADHETVRAVLERDVPAEKCGFGHTASIQFGREYCKARKPVCLEDPDACPLGDVCEQVGVYPKEGEVVDPSDAA